MVQALKIHPERNNTSIQLSKSEKSFINSFRLYAAECRTNPRLDIFEALKLFDSNKPLSKSQQMNIFVRTLGQAVDQPLVWLKVGCKDFSFDEKWIAAVFKAYRTNDISSYNFMTMRKIPDHKRSIFSLMLSLLSKNIAKKFNN